MKDVTTVFSIFKASVWRVLTKILFTFINLTIKSNRMIMFEVPAFEYYLIMWANQNGNMHA